MSAYLGYAKLGVRGVKRKEGSKFSRRVTAETKGCVGGFVNRIRKELLFACLPMQWKCYIQTECFSFGLLITS